MPEDDHEQTPITPPQTSAGDHWHTVGTAALAGIPLAGGSVATLFAHIIAPPLIRRTNEWIRQVSDAIEDLRARSSDFPSAEDLSKDDAFLSAFLRASEAAVRTHQTEKLDALRNAVLGIAAGRAFGEERRTLFLRFIDELGELHLKCLKLLSEPRRFFPPGRNQPR